MADNAEYEGGQTPSAADVMGTLGCDHPGHPQNYSHRCEDWGFCLAHLEREPCQTCAACIAGGL